MVIEFSLRYWFRMWPSPATTSYSPLVKVEVITIGLIERSQPEVIDRALGDVHPPGLSAGLHVVCKSDIVAPHIVPGQEGDSCGQGDHEEDEQRVSEIAKVKNLLPLAQPQHTTEHSASVDSNLDRNDHHPRLVDAN